MAKRQSCLLPRAREVCFESLALAGGVRVTAVLLLSVDVVSRFPLVLFSVLVEG
jgi:hypothetical protein